jgi:hypothetical protein
MVVVNDATHLVDRGTVGVTVLSTRPTSQGVMVFAKLTPENGESDEERGDLSPAERPLAG